MEKKCLITINKRWGCSLHFALKSPDVQYCAKLKKKKKLVIIRKKAIKSGLINLFVFFLVLTLCIPNVNISNNNIYKK